MMNITFTGVVANKLEHKERKTSVDKEAMRKNQIRLFERNQNNSGLVDGFIRVHAIPKVILTIYHSKDQNGR